MKYIKPIALALIGLLTAPIPLAGANNLSQENNNKQTTSEVVQTAGQMPAAAETKYKVFRHSHKTDALEVYYPQVDLPSILTSALVNYQLIQAPGHYMADAPPSAKLQIDYTVTRQDDNLISVVFRGEQTQDGSALPLLTSVNYNLKSRLPVTAQRLLKNTADAKQNVSRLLRQSANAGTAGAEIPDISDLTDFYITGKYIVFYYQANDSAAKFIELPVAIDLLKPYLSDEYGSLAVTQEVQKDPRQIIADIDKSLISYQSVSGKHDTPDSSADFTAYFDNGQLMYIDEKQTGDEYHTSRAKYYYDHGKLVAFRKSVQSLNIPEASVASVQREETSMFYDAALNLTDGEQKVDGVVAKLPDEYIKEVYAASDNLMRLAAEQWTSQKDNQ